MKIQEEIVEDLAHVAIHPTRRDYPQCPELDLPRLYFVSSFVGTRGSGKTYSACMLLKYYERFGLKYEGHTVPQRIILVSPTYRANKPYFDCLKYFDETEDLHETYSEALMLGLRQRLESEAKEAEKYQRQLKLWKRCLKARSIDEFDMEEHLELQAMGWGEPTRPQYPWGVATFLVLDDCVGSSAYKMGKSEFTKFVLGSRHFNCSVLMMVQSIKALPKSVRINSSVYVLFKFASTSIVCKDLYEEVSADYSLEQFEAIYAHCIRSSPHGSLVIDNTQKDPARRLKSGWDTVLRINSEGNIESEDEDAGR